MFLLNLNNFDNYFGISHIILCELGANQYHVFNQAYETLT